MLDPEILVLDAVLAQVRDGQRISPGGWRIHAAAVGDEYQPQRDGGVDRPVCPLGALLLTYHVLRDLGPIDDAAELLNVGVGWILGYCRAFDSGVSEHPNDHVYLRGAVCNIFDLRAGRRAGARARRRLEEEKLLHVPCGERIEVGTFAEAPAPRISRYYAKGWQP